MKMRVISSFSLALLFLGLCNAACRSDVKAILLDPANNWAANTTITFPDSGSAFKQATERWSPYNAPTFAAAISPGTESDVALAVRIARKYKIEFLATGGRHSYADTLKNIHNGLSIDLSNLKSVHVEQENAKLIVGGGVRGSDITAAVSEAGMEIPVGSCSCPGVVGVAIGAGINAWGGIHGLVLDSLLSVRVVTAAGELLEASETLNADLFWAIRGAGANFGIITSATFQLYPPTNNNEMSVIEGILPPAANMSFYNALAAISENQPAELYSANHVIFEPNMGVPVIAFSFVYLGPKEDALKLLAPVLDLNPFVPTVDVVPWSEFHSTILQKQDPVTCVAGTVRTTYAGSAKELSIPYLLDTFKAAVEFFEQYPGGRQTIFVVRGVSNHATVAVPEEATAYPWRDAKFYMENLFSFHPNDTATASVADALGRQLREHFFDTSGYDGGACYVNNARGDDPIERVYGAHKLPRLAALKNTWDPENVFKYHHALPTKYP